MSTRSHAFVATSAVLGLAPSALAGSDEQNLHLHGLHHRASAVRDHEGIVHVSAQDEHDLLMLQGYFHAMDRLFQMDVNRRLASGTLAELLGPGALPSDVQLRTIGLRRAAERSLAASSPELVAGLQAYADGVNAFVAGNALPIEYGVLELSQFDPWTPTDSLVIGRLVTFGLAFEIDVDSTIEFLTYLQAGQLLGFDGAALYFDDVHRCAGFDPAATVPDAGGSSAPKPPVGGARPRGPSRWVGRKAAATIAPATLELARGYVDRIRDIPAFASILDPTRRAGSNEWAVAGSLTTSGRPLLANDPHLPLTTPATWYPIHLSGGPFNVTGNSFAGIPYVILGHDDSLAWGATNDLVDVTDTYQETVVADPNSPSGLSTVYLGQLEPIVPIPESYRQNNPGDGIFDDLTDVPPSNDVPPATLIVPRRNNGPILALDVASGFALSIQYVGFSPTRELEAFRLWNQAHSLNDFRAGLDFYDVGSQNWAVADVAGNVAYYTSGEWPIREDLAAGSVNGLPPFFIRNGAGGNEWAADATLGKHQAIPYQKVRGDDQPQIVNPPNGWFVNANNDPSGFSRDNDPLDTPSPEGGILYLNYSFDDGYRAGRISQLLQEKLASGPVSIADLQEIQSDTVCHDAGFFVPQIVNALARAQSGGVNAQLQALGADPAIVEAVGRIGSWALTSPTGIKEGYDASDVDGTLSDPTQAEIDASVACTLYSTWRGRFIASTFDATLLSMGLPNDQPSWELKGLKNLLASFDANLGVGASGISFFQVAGVADPHDARDVLILASVKAALELLSGPAFDPVFHRSTTQADYKWGLLHRLILDHPLGDPFTTPPAGGAFPPPLNGLLGIPCDGAWETVDNSPFDLYTSDFDACIFRAGPSERFACELDADRPRGFSSLPGGTSGVLGDPNYVSLLPSWLTNEAYALLLTKQEVQSDAAFQYNFRPD